MMARIEFPNFHYDLSADIGATETALPLPQEATDELLNGMRHGDYTYLLITGAIYREAIKVTKNGSVLEVTRAACGHEARDFMVGDCIDPYDGNCGEPEEEACHPDIISSDNSILFEGSCEDRFDLTINPDALPDSADEFLCGLSEGALLAGDVFLAMTEQGGSCAFKHITISELCSRLQDCNGSGGGADSCEDCASELRFDITENGHLIVYYPNNTSNDLGLVVGPPADTPLPGIDGQDGTDGTDGRAITNAVVQNGELILYFDQAPFQQNVGTVKGEDGATIEYDGDDWIDVAGTVISHNPAQTSVQSINGLSVDANGHVVSVERQVVRYSGNVGAGTTTLTDGLTVFYGTIGVDQATFFFDTPMPHANYHVSINRADGTPASYGIVGKATTGFAVSGPPPNEDVTIFIHV